MQQKSEIKALSSEELEQVAGGATKAYITAVRLMNGEFGSGEDSRAAIAALGLDYWSVQHMANALSQGYGQVAKDVIDGKYGKDAARFKALSLAGYDPILVQRIVKGMVKDE